MKIQTVEAIEREDFSRMPAAIYCKGFIKLYAEYMGLDPDPLTREYVERFVEPPPPPEPEEPEDEQPHIFNIGFNKKEDLPPIAQEEEDEDHPSLFEYGENRNEEPPEKLFDHPPPKQEKEAQDQISLGERIADISSKIKDAAAQAMERFRRSPEEETVSPEVPEEVTVEPDHAVDTSPITLPNRQILIISGAVVGAILLVFLISVIAGLLSDDDKTIIPDESPDQELLLPVDPPPPYID
jgi:type IV secretory pathway VirB10-like protein